MEVIEVFEADYDGQWISVYENESVIVVDREGFEAPEGGYSPAEIGTALEMGLPVEFVWAIINTYADECAKAARRRRAATRGVK